MFYSDVPPKVATGTIALKVQDSNDHCPELTSTYQSTCSDNNVIHVTAFDEDAHPNAEPYKFVLIEEETRGKWEMVPINGKADSKYSVTLKFLYIKDNKHKNMVYFKN